MSRRAQGGRRDLNNQGNRVSVGKVGRTVSLSNGRADVRADGQDDLHQQIAERAYLLYERSGFQDGQDLEHWLEAERQIKGVRDQAA